MRKRQLSCSKGQGETGMILALFPRDNQAADRPRDWAVGQMVGYLIGLPANLLRLSVDWST